MRRLFLALSWLLLSGYTTTVVPTALSPVAQIAWNAQGTYQASTLPRMCVNGHIATAGASQTLSLLSMLGTTCARVDFNWDSIEQSAGSYPWTTATFGGATFSSFFGALCGAGIQPIFAATYNNPLYASGVFTPVTAGANATAWGNFAAAEAAEAIALGCPTPIIEAFNEPNDPQWTTTQWSGSSYAAAFATFLSKIKTVSGAKALSGGVTPGGSWTQPTPWVAQMVSAGAAISSVDGYALHPYNYDNATQATANPDVLLTDLRAFWLYAASGGSAKPVPVTEWGYPWDAFTATVTQAGLNKQGVYIGWGLLNAILANVTLGSPGVPYFAIYDLVDDGTNYATSNQYSFGLFFNGSASSGSPITGASAYGIKPAGTAFKSVTGAMASASSYSISYDIANSAPTIAFVNSLGTNFAIWTTDAGSSKSWSKAIGSFSSVTCKDLIGNTVSCPYSGGNLSATLSTSTGPILATALN